MLRFQSSRSVNRPILELLAGHESLGYEQIAAQLSARPDDVRTALADLRAPYANAEPPWSGYKSAAMGAGETTFDYEALHERAASPWTAGIGFLWGFAEATLFFIIPDVLLGAVALFAPRAAPRVLLFTLAGALAGGALTYGVASELHPLRSRALLDGVPTVNHTAIRRVEREMRDDGARSIVYGPLRMGTPYKLYARAAAVEGEELSSFMIWSIPGRLERMLPVTLLAALVGLFARRQIAARPRTVLAFYGALWLAVYIAYVVRVGV